MTMPNNPLEQEQMPKTCGTISSRWTDADIEQLLWDAKVLTLAGVYGFRKAATDAFLGQGYRLATITTDSEPFDKLFKLSLYAIGDGPRLGRKEATKLARDVMDEIGFKLKANECHGEVSGRRLVVTAMLPWWVRI
jgi:hypothetical protein